MNSTIILPIVLTFIGIIFLSAGLKYSCQIKSNININQSLWTLLCLMILFFIIGYFGFIFYAFMLAKKSQSFQFQTLISLVFLSGGIFVFLVCELFSSTLYKISQVNNLIADYNQLKKKADLDTLTGCYNRSYLEELFKNKLDLFAITKKSFAIFFVDLNLFKKINDTLGHLAGDKVLKDFCHLLESTIRRTDVVIRYGGDEFVLVVDCYDLKSCELMAQDIVKAVDSKQFEFENNKFNVYCAIGMLLIDTKINNLEQAIEIADSSCYAAKKICDNCSGYKS